MYQSPVSLFTRSNVSDLMGQTARAARGRVTSFAAPSRNRPDSCSVSGRCPVALYTANEVDCANVLLVGDGVCTIVNTEIPPPTPTPTATPTPTPPGQTPTSTPPGQPPTLTPGAVGVSWDCCRPRLTNHRTSRRLRIPADSRRGNRDEHDGARGSGNRRHLEAIEDIGVAGSGVQLGV
jgi:hypothetical protein